MFFHTVFLVAIIAIVAVAMLTRGATKALLVGVGLMIVASKIATVALGGELAGRGGFTLAAIAIGCLIAGLLTVGLATKSLVSR